MAATPLAQLREIRDAQKQAKTLLSRRDALIRRAVREHSQRQVAEAAGISQARVNQIVKGGK
jgi:predicted XRE-type DNA-binding protein